MTTQKADPVCADNLAISSIFTGGGHCVCYHRIAHMLQGIGSVHTLPPESELFWQDTPVDTIYLIESGLIKLSHYSPKGKEILVGLRRPYWLLGSAPLILGRQRSLSATTLSSCTLRFITRDQFNALLKDIAFSGFLTCMMSLEISGQVKRMIAFSSMSGEVRLMQFVAEIISTQTHRKATDEITLSIPLKLSQIAQILDMTPEHLSRIMKRLEQKGLFTHARNLFTITNPARFMKAYSASVS